MTPADPDQTTPRNTSADPPGADRTTAWLTRPARRDETTEVPRLPPRPGTVGPYEVLGEVGRGGMGVVLRAHDPALGREVAVKLLGGPLAGEPEYVRRFEEEARFTGRLQHPGIVPVYDLGRLADTRPYFAMKLVEGRTLADELAARPTPAADRGRFLRIFQQVAQAVGYAHSRGVIHRDLKPQNVMVGAFGEVQLMDWGLAKQVRNADFGMRSEDTDDPSRTDLLIPHSEIRIPESDDGTRAGVVLGTPSFMPPEQATGAIDQLDARSDVFGLGGILCVVLTGKPPYVGATGRQVAKMAAAGELADAHARLNECGADAELVDLCRRCLSAEKAGRPADGGAVAEAVGAYLAGVEDRARRAEVERAAAEARAGEERKRRRVQLALAACALLLGGAVGFGAYWREKTEADRREELARVEGERQTELARVDGERKAEQARADAERAAAADRLRDSAAAAVRLAAGLRGQYRFEEAKEALDQAGRLVPADGPADARAALEQAAADLALVVELDDIRMRRSSFVPAEGEAAGAGPAEARPALRGALQARGLDDQGDFDIRSAPPAYRAAFAARGLDVAGGDPAAVGGRVRASAARAELVAALDDWALWEPDAAVRGRVLAAARAADPGPWLDRFRDPAVRADKGRVLELVKESDPAALAPGTIAALAEVIDRHGVDSTPLLRRGQLARPDDYLIAAGIADRLYVRGRPEAVAHYRAARALRPRNPAVLCHLGLALAQDGNTAEARRCLREAVRLDPAQPRTHYALGLALLRTGKDNAEAAAALREAVRLGPGFSKAHFELGIVLGRLGDRPGAIASYRESIRLDPSVATAHRLLGEELAKGNELDAAVGCYREALRLAPHYAAAHVVLGDALYRKGDWAGAAASYRAAAGYEPWNARAHYSLGVALSRVGDLTGTLVSYRQAVRLDPGHAGYRKSLDAAEGWAARTGRNAPPPREVRWVAPPPRPAKR